MNKREAKDTASKNQFRSIIAKRTEKSVKEPKVISPEKLAEKAIRYEAFLKAKEFRKSLRN